MDQKLEEIKKEAKAKLMAVLSLQEAIELKVKYLGKKGKLTEIIKQIGTLSPEERPKLGQIANKIRGELEEAIAQKSDAIKKEQQKRQLLCETIDVTMPGRCRNLGNIHPLSAVSREIEDIFINMGFSLVDGPEIELDYYNFEALNIPEGHPAREEKDTFYINEDILLRTETSTVQIRTMETQAPPIKIISPGRVYRADETDATHSPIFHQIEGLVVDKGVSFSDLKGTLQLFTERFLGKGAVVRFRPHYFPFTEPSAEIDVQCFECKGEGCKICKGEGWIEIFGCGMVHRKVLENCGIDPEIYSGFAFAMGLERITMRRYNVKDLRLFYENDIRFLKQF